MTFRNKAIDFEMVVDDEVDDRAGTDRPARADRPTAVLAIVEAAFEAALTPALRRRLHASNALAITITVPSPAWILPVEAWFKSVFGSGWKLFGREKQKSGPTGLEENLDAARYLAKGYSVAGIAAEVTALPLSLTRATDVAIRVARPSGEVLREAIVHYTGRPCPLLLDGVGEGLDLPDLVAAFRPGSGAKRIVLRLQRASQSLAAVAVSSGPVPDLTTAVEYGAARIWGLNLAEAVKNYRSGVCQWSDLPRGLLLAGPPGTGKSLYSRALAAACNVPICSMSIADLFAEGNRAHLDDVIRNFGNFMDRCIAMAKSGTPVIAFIDEIDSLPNRLALSSSHNGDYWKPVVNYVLTRLDDSGSTTREGVIVVAATNDASSLDPALLRPGRLELTINLEPPDFEGTVNILKFHAPEIPESDLREIAVIVEGIPGAEIMYLVREARQAARRGQRALSVADLEKMALPDTDFAPAALYRIAVHEAGHATARLALKAGTVKRCVIGAKNGRGGHVLYRPDETDLVTRTFIENEVIVALSGRSAERVLLAGESAGGGGGEDSDIGVATKMIATMHATSGMGDTIAYMAPASQVIHAMNLDPRLQARVERDLQALQKRADDLIHKHKNAVEAIAMALRDRRHLSEGTIRQLFAGHSSSAHHNH